MVVVLFSLVSLFCSRPSFLLLERDVNTVLRREGPFVAPGFDKDDHSLQLLADTRVLVM